MTAQLLAAATAVRQQLDAPLPTADRSAYEQSMVTLRSRLSLDQLTMNWQQGVVLELAAVVALALST